MSDNSVSKALGAEEAIDVTTVKKVIWQTLGTISEETGRPLTEEDIIVWAEKENHEEVEADKLEKKEKPTEKATDAEEDGNDDQQAVGTDETLSNDETPSAGRDDCDQISSVADIRLEDTHKDGDE